MNDYLEVLKGYKDVKDVFDLIDDVQNAGAVLVVNKWNQMK